jgi:hypothetical protein
MGGGILANLLRRVDDSVYKGLGNLDRFPNGIGMGAASFKQRANQRLDNLDEVFRTQDPSKLLGQNNLKIRDAGGSGSPLLQEIYARMTRR